jgi:hypothetical protein
MSLKWTTERPARAGWYWHRGPFPESSAIIVEVDEDGYFKWPDGSFDDVHVISGWWAGPVPVPDDPTDVD